MAKSTKPPRTRRPLGKASRVSQKTGGPKAVAGAKKAPARKGASAPRRSAVAGPRIVAGRAAAKVSPPYPPPHAREGSVKASATKWVYAFGGSKAEGGSEMRDLLGGKGANLAEMANLGLSVPPGFTIITEVCSYFYSHDKTYPKELRGEVETALAAVGRIAGGKTFGDGSNPLLVSVRSGARASMPGMMDTVLNLGLNDITVEALAKNSGDRRFAYDSYRRFITMYANVVLGIEHHVFEEILDEHKDVNGYTSIPTSTLRIGPRSSPASRRGSKSCAALHFRRSRTRSCGGRSVPCSARG
jgi:pyruvate, orthophosphate dikinase